MEYDSANILLVEDNPLVKSEVHKYLKKIGIEANIDLRSPENIDQNIVEILPDKEELNSYDFALVDLELYPLKKDIEYAREDLSGGTEVLPYLRKKAPWLPIIAESRLFDEESGYFFAIAGSFGFDGHFSRHVFQSKSFSRRLWDTILENAILNRKKEIIGYEFEKGKENLEIVIGASSEKKLYKNFNNWKNLLKDMFFFSDKITLEFIGGGFSGAITLRSKVIRQNIFDRQEGNWLIKISNNPHKLQSEINAHINVFRSGIEYARSVPLLYEKVLCQKGNGIIAYQFADHTNVAEEIITDQSSAKKYCKILLPLFENFYSRDKRIADNDTVRNLALPWFRSNKIKTLIKKNPEFKTVTRINSLVHKEPDEVLDKIIKFQKCWLHGDLHLRNILIGQRSILIDFARSKPGPIALDLAMFASSLLLRVPELRNNRIPKIKDKNSKLNEGLKALFQKMQMLEGDKELYDLFLEFYLAKALVYDDNDIDKKTKAWIKLILHEKVEPTGTHI